MIDYYWVGSQKHFVDELNVLEFKSNMVLGRFGGNSTAGQYKNEDGCLIWANPEEDWEFVMFLDAHNLMKLFTSCYLFSLVVNLEKIVKK